MPKPVPLTPAIMDAPPITPEPVAPARTAVKPVAPPKPAKEEQLPLQVRLPRREVKAIKIAAAEHEQTVSDFMLACFHAYMRGQGGK